MRPSELMLDLGRPVAFYPGLAKHVGGVNACLFVCQLLYWSDRTDSEMGVYKTAEEWTRETGLSYKEQATARRKLRELGLITEIEKRLEHKIYYLLDVDTLNTLIESANTPTGQPRKSHRAVRGGPEGGFVHTEITTETTAETKPSLSDDISEVFDHWRVKMNSPRSKLDANRKTLITNALKHYTVDDLKQAVDGCAGSPYHMGTNDQKTKYNGLDLILRNAEKIEGFMVKATNRPVAPKQSSITKDFSQSTYKSTPDDQLADFLQ